MDRETVMASLRSFMRLEQEKCRDERRDFDVADAIAAATPVLDMLFYEIDQLAGKQPAEPVDEDDHNVGIHVTAPPGTVPKVDDFMKGLLDGK